MTHDLVILGINENDMQIAGLSVVRILILYEENSIMKLDSFERVNKNCPECDFDS